MANDLRIVTLVGGKVYHKAEFEERVTLCGINILIARGSIRGEHTTDAEMQFLGRRLCRRCAAAITAREDVGDLSEEQHEQQSD